MVIRARPAVLATSVLIAALFVGCVTSPRETFYTLPSDRTSIRPFNGSSIANRIVVGPITLPELIDRPQFVVRVGPNQVAIAEQHRWAEPLKSQIARVIAQNLTQFLGATQVRTEYQSQNDDAEYRVLLDIQEFESMLGQGVTIEVYWTIRRTSGNEVQTGRPLLRQPVVGKGYEALVAAHGRAFAVVSLEIASTIQQSALRSREMLPVWKGSVQPHFPLYSGDKGSNVYRGLFKGCSCTL